MNHILELLQEKNYHLRRFYDLNEIELVNFVEGKFDNLEQFYNSRESILDLIKCIDRLIEQSHFEKEEGAHLEQDFKSKMLAAMAERKEIATRILSQDLQILSVLEATKSNLIKELSQVRVARKAVKAYKGQDNETHLDKEL